MKSLRVKGMLRSTEVLVGESIDNLQRYLPGKEVFIISDRQVYPMLEGRLPQYPVLQVYPGDYSKSLRMATSIYRWLQDNYADRSAFLLGLGGGVVSDLTGFVAATYLRGVNFGLVPTTLLGQIDASIGGKNAINFDGFKNVVGTIYHPEFILCDHTLLATLPKEEVQGGIAELVKHTIIASEERFNEVNENAEAILSINHDVLDPLIGWSIELKRGFVEDDEFDNGDRRKLNFGHTWGHAVEAVTGMHHGFAVAIGMVFAARFAYARGLCDASVVERITKILQRFGLPTEADVLPWVVYEAIERDKKRDHDSIRFVFPRRIGEASIETIKLEELREFIDGKGHVAKGSIL